MSQRMFGLLALVAAAAVIWALPAASIGQGGLEGAGQALDETTKKLGATVEQTLERTSAGTGEAAAPVTQAASEPATKAASEPATKAAAPTAPGAQTRQAPAGATDPPLHGTNPHGQGTVALADVNPSPQRPQGGDTNGSNSGEEVVVGRSRGEEQSDGSYRGKITIAALFGNDIVAVETKEGETRTGPLEPVQQAILDPLCTGTDQQICLSAVTADSTTTDNGSSNRFSVANAQLGGADGISVGAAESEGAISEDANCQTATGSSRAASVRAGGGPVADVATTSSRSRSCKDGTREGSSESRVIGLGGQGVPLPAPGCGDGTPDTVIEIPLLLTIVCNADSTMGATAVRDALDVFVLNAGDSSVLKLAVAGSEAITEAPGGGGPGTETGPECSDRVDNDGDGRIDAADPGCHTDGNPDNPDSYDPNDDSEAGGGRGQGDKAPTGGSGGEGRGGGSGAGDPQCSDGRDNDGDGLVDARDPGCHTDGDASNPASYVPSDDSEANGARGSGAPACSDGVDNDGDGVADARDPGCHTDGNADNPASYDPNDDSESDVGALRSGNLPFSGTDVVGLVLAGLLLLAGGLVLRRREQLLPR